MTKIAGSGSGSISQRHGYPDPDPHQNVMDPEHCVQGMKTFGIDLKVASKFFSQKFACSSSVTGDDEIVIQGDVKDDLFDILPEKWPEIDEDLIDDIGEKKRS
jgi:hypothetical protein